jgi:hypothetical protein
MNLKSLTQSRKAAESFLPALIPTISPGEKELKKALDAAQSETGFNHRSRFPIQRWQVQGPALSPLS